jgi:hypothetical protein
MKNVFCLHEFNYLQDMINTGRIDDKRIMCSCHKCGKEFHAHCGLDLIKYGKLIQKPN